MRNIQESILSMLREHSTRKHLAAVVCMVAIATAFAVFWSLRISGITLTSDDPICGMQEHTHTDACYDWVATVTDGTEEIESIDETETTEAVEIIDETEIVETVEITETTETEEATDEVSAEESAEAYESASVEEDTSIAEETATEAVTGVTETGTESVTETPEEDATEEITEELTEEETETPQPWDTKVVDGVTYVYELVCGMEEHVHTDECYESDDDDAEEDTDAAEESGADDEELELTAGVATVSAYGISLATDDGEDSNSGEGEDDEESVSISAQAASFSYYYGDPVTLSDVYKSVSGGETNDYIIYTIIDNSYYVLTAEGNLVKCDGYGKYPSASSNDSMQISMLATADYFDAMRWNLTLNSETDAANSVYDYYIQNSTYGTTVTGQYLAPSATETISSSDTATGENNNAGTSSRYEMSGNGTMVFTITSDAETSDGTFWVEIYDNNGAYITTTSGRGSWYYGVSNAPGITTTYDEESAATINASTEYTVTVTRSGDSNEYFEFVYSYYDSDRDANVIFAKYTTTASSNIAADINLHVIAVSGTYSVEAAYSDDAPMVTESTGYENTTSDTVNNSVSTGSYDNNTGTNLTSTSEDFDITYSFTNTSDSGSDYWDTFAVEINNGKSETDYACITLLADSNWWEYYYSGSAWAWDKSGVDSYTVDIQTDPYNISTNSTYASSWNSDMQTGTSCEVRVVKVSDSTNETATLTFYVKVTNSSSEVIMYYIATFTASAFYDCTTSVYLTGEDCTLSDISYTMYDTSYVTITTELPTVDDTTTKYARYSTTAQNTVITGDTSGNGWTAKVTLSGGGTYYLYGEANTAGVNSSEWGSSDTASGTSITGKTLTDTNNTASRTATFYFAEVREYTASFDASDGGDLAFAASGRAAYFYTANNTSSGRAQQIVDGSAVIYEVTSYADEYGNCYINMPYATAPSNRYAWMMQGWYDVLGINNSIVSSGYYSYLGSGTVADAQYTYQLWDYDSAVVQILGDTVFYADWVAFTYNLADGTEDGALTDVDDGGSTADEDGYGGGSVSISSFVTTDVFDYGNLINLLSSCLSDSVDITSMSLSAADLTDQWSLAGWGSASNLLTNSLGLIFINNSSYTGSLSFPNRSGVSGSLEDFNQNNNAARTTGIVSYVKEQSGNDLLSYLFNTDDEATGAFRYDSENSSWEGVVGKTYVGTGDYLFQYNEQTAYYYYDSARNAASYNQTDKRFYLFDYTVKVNSGGSENDFLPFNYVSKANSSTAVATANADYWFGLHTTIDFYLPDAVGTVTNSSTATTSDEYVYGNQSMDRNMKFVFMGDDDVWVYVDGYLVLDLGGIHGQEYGEIDFSSGLVTIVDGIGQTYYYTSEDHTAVTTSTTSYGSATGRELFLTEDEDGMYEITSLAYSTGVVTTYTFYSSAADASKGIYYIADSTDGVSGMTAEAAASIAKSGSHTLNLYYLERGAGQSNLAVYFNISPSYDMVLTKADATDESTTLDNAVFEIYELSDISGYVDSSYSSLKSYITAIGNYVGEYDTNDSDTGDSDTDHAVSVSNLQPGHTYYIVETEAPESYPLSGKVIQVYVDTSRNMTVNVLNSSGTVIESYEYTYSTNTTVTSVTATGSSFVSSTITANYNEETGEYVVYLTVLNAYEYELPDTGSMGVFPYRRAGTVLVLVSITGLLITAFYHLVWVRKLRTSVNNKGYTEEKRKRGNHFARTRDHPRERSRAYGRDAPAAFADSEMKRSRGTGPGTE